MKIRKCEKIDVAQCRPVSVLVQTFGSRSNLIGTRSGCQDTMGNLYSILRFWEEEPYDDDSESEDVILSNIVEQYAAQVLDFSSQYGSDRSFSYTAANCLGLPSKFPSYGDFPQTFVFRTFGNFWEKVDSIYILCPD